MFIKYSGLALLFLSVVYYGQYKAYTYRARIKQLEAFVMLIRFIKSQIEYFHLPLEEIFIQFNDKVLAKSEFLQILNSDGWIKALEDSKLYLNEDIIESLRMFGGELGKSGKEEQINNCDYTLLRLEASLKEFNNELPKRTKVCTSLSLMAGIMLVIILI